MNTDAIDDFDMQKEYGRDKTVKMIDNLMHTFYKVHPSQIYKLHSFNNADEFIAWTKKSRQVSKMSNAPKEVDITIDLSCAKNYSYAS